MDDHDLGTRFSQGLLDDLEHCMDVDAHEMTPVHRWHDTFPSAGTDAIDIWSALPTWDQESDNALKVDCVDDVSITDETVWTVRGVRAPGAFDLTRRTEVLDQMGIERQLVFPTFGVCALMMLVDPRDSELLGCSTLTNFPLDPSVDSVKLARDLIAGHNDWAIRVTKDLGTDRLRVVGIVETESVDQMMADTAFLLERGLRAIVIPCGQPPAGLSPADEALDPFYALLEQYDAALTLHVGTEYPLLRSRVWDANVPAFRSSRTNINEFPMQPYWGVTINFAPENFLAVLTLGGVFERHPQLRFGCFENGAQWLGPFAERMDLWAEEFRSRLKSVLSLPPSSYINRQVRVAPFTFEDVALYFDRYPQVANSFCYFSDYPHREGGKSSKETFLRRLDRAGEDTIRRFFIDNGRLLLPD